MPKTATGKVQRRLVAQAMLARDQPIASSTPPSSAPIEYPRPLRIATGVQTGVPNEKGNVDITRKQRKNILKGFMMKVKVISK